MDLLFARNLLEIGTALVLSVESDLGVRGGNTGGLSWELLI